MVHNAVGNALVAPQGAAAALHVANARYVVDDAHVVAVAGPQFGEQFGIVAPRGLALEVVLVTYADGGRGVVVCHTAVFDVHAGHAVGGGRHDVVVVKAEVAWCEVDGAVPILCGCAAAQAQVPFAYGGGGVACAVHEVGHGGLARFYNHAGIARCHIGAGAAERVFASEQRVARRGGRGGAGVHVSHAHPVGGQTVDGGGAHPCGAIAGQVAIAKVVGHEYNDIGFELLCSGTQGEGCQQACKWFQHNWTQK